MTNTTNTADISANTSHLTSVAVPKPKNALVHGIYATEIVLPWESPEDFERLHKEVRIEWTPEGRTEQETVLALARLHWLKHRLMRSTQMAFRKDPLVCELEKSGVKTWADVASFLQNKAKADDSVMDEARKTLKELATAVKNASALMTASDPNTGKIYQDIEFLNDMFKKNILPVYGKVFEKVYGKDYVHGAAPTNNASKTAIEEAYHPDYLEKIVRLEASIDTRIDKTLQRLVSIKEYKRLIKPTTPTIASPSIAASESTKVVYD